MGERLLGFKSAGWMAGETPGTMPPIMQPPGMDDPCAVPVMAQFDPQPWDIYGDTETGFRRGTIFPALDLPFIGKGACRHE